MPTTFTQLKFILWFRLIEREMTVIKYDWNFYRVGMLFSISACTLKQFSFECCKIQNGKLCANESQSVLVLLLIGRESGASFFCFSFFFFFLTISVMWNQSKRDRSANYFPRSSENRCIWVLSFYNLILLFFFLRSMWRSTWNPRWPHYPIHVHCFLHV